MDGIFNRIIVAIIFALTIGIVSAYRLHGEFIGTGKDGRRLYSSFSYYAALPLFLLIYAVAVLIALSDTAQNRLLSMFFSVFLTLSAYYIVLAPLIPWLRRHISAWACAALWLVPNVLYVLARADMRLPAPLLVIETSEGLTSALLAVWLAGFLLIMAWKTTEHLLFRRRVLKNAEKLKNPLWEEVFAQVCPRMNRPPLYRSKELATPLTIGLFSGNRVVVLPERYYTDEELRLVLTHEAIHIARFDAVSKLGLVSMAAFCWFDPLVWLAMRKSAEDIELSCDESVTFGVSADERRRYADLILSSAGDGRGFTTCLSAKASSLRYRLKNVMQPPIKSSGALVIGIATFLLILICGQVALAYGGGTGEELIFNSDDPALYVVDENDCTDPDGLKDHIASLELMELNGKYDLDLDGEKHRLIVFDAPGDQGKQISVDFYDNIVEFRPLFIKLDHWAEYYYLPEGTDWERLDAMF
ncbi:MAG: M56 family metallopeptidase [Candidatus Scatomorpha sp.]|jgi:beta-lactamase regulating signal transducer with metallopeptidase domain